MGGHGTHIFIQLDPNYFAAAAPSAGSGLRRTEKFIEPAKIKKQFDYAERIGAQFVVMAGAQEERAQSIQVKNLGTGVQSELALDGLGSFDWA